MTLTICLLSFGLFFTSSMALWAFKLATRAAQWRLGTEELLKDVVFLEGEREKLQREVNNLTGHNNWLKNRLEKRNCEQDS